MDNAPNDTFFNLSPGRSEANVPAGANAPALRDMGNSLLASGKARESIPYYEQALRLQPDWFEVYNLLGAAHAQIKNWDKACESYRQAVQINPGFAPAYNNLGNALLHGQGKVQEAVTALGEAFRLLPSNPNIALNLGVALDMQGEQEQAVRCYRHALQLRPGNAAIRSQLAATLRTLGEIEEAVDQFREIVRLEPNNAVACAYLANFAAEGFYPIQASEIVPIQAFLNSGRGSAWERQFCYFALGAVLDKQGCYDEAFGYFQRGNEMNLRRLQEKNLAFNAEDHHCFIDRIMAIHSQSYLQAVKEWGLPDERPIFIVGMPRSGSTLVEQILASHTRVFGAGERDNLYKFITQGPATRDPDVYASSLPSHSDIARKQAADYAAYLANLGQGAERVTVKTNENYLHLGLIATLFPRARIIHCRRDPVDVCLSCYFQNFQSADFVWSLEDIGAYYGAYEKMMAHWSRVLPVQIFELSYEDLVQNQETVTRNLLSFCGLNWDEHCLSFYNTRRAVRTASVLQVRKPISGQAIGRWKHYRSHLDPLFRVLGRGV